MTSQRAWELEKEPWMRDFHLYSLMVGLVSGGLFVLLVVYIKTWRSSRRRQRVFQRLEKIYSRRWKHRHSPGSGGDSDG